MSNDNKYPINGYAPGHYWCVCGECKERFTGDKRSARCEPCALKEFQLLDLQLPTTNNPLPPELVEKFKLFVNTMKESYQHNAEQCAQIAVDYAAENSFNSISACAKLSLEKSDLEQQRDELVEALKSKYDYLEEIAMLITSDNWTEQFRTKWNSEMTSLEQLLKKHEDGKE